jgi:iron complex outermembrane receptor protein
VVSLWGSFFENDLTPYRLDLVGGGDCFILRGELCRYYFYVRPNGGNRLNQTNVDVKGRVQTGWLRQEVLVGFDYYDADRNGASYFQPVSPISVFNPVFTPVAPLNTSTTGFQTVDRTRWASGYLQDIVALGARVRLMASVRFDGTSAIYAAQGTKPNQQNFVTPRFGAVWEFARGHSFYGQYQDAVDANNGRNPANGQELAAERSRQVEAGYKLSAAAYRLGCGRNETGRTILCFLSSIR